MRIDKRFFSQIETAFSAVGLPLSVYTATGEQLYPPSEQGVREEEIPHLDFAEGIARMGSMCYLRLDNLKGMVVGAPNYVPNCDQILNMAGILLSAMAGNLDHGMDRDEVLRRVLLDGLNGTELETLAAEHGLEMDRARCAVFFYCEGDARAVEETLHEVFSGSNSDLVVRLDRNSVALLRAMDGSNHDELGELAQQFNRMVLSLRRNQQALLQNQQALNDAQIRMMQAQLNPHFLCNTLDTMKWISKINQVPQVALMSTNLADILRFCISPDEFVELRRELEILGRYVEIQRIRLSDSFTFEQDVPEALLSCMVPKMMLQPLAENAILHGLSGVPDGRLSVTAQQLEGEVLEIRVCDNGCGFPADMLGQYKPPAQPTGHLGLLNVDTILRKHYGEQFGLRLENRTDEPGACIAAQLPVRRRKAEC